MLDDINDKNENASEPCEDSNGLPPDELTSVGDSITPEERIESGGSAATEADAAPEDDESAEKKKTIARKQETVRILKYLFFTCSAGAIQIGSSTLFWEVFHWSYWTGYLVALVLSVIWNFTFNRKFTFKSANNVPLAMLKVFGYYCVFTPLSTWWGHALAGLGWNNYAIEIPTMLINGITEFLFNRFVVFGKSINTNDLGKKENEKVKEELQHFSGDNSEAAGSDETDGGDKPGTTED